MAEFPGSERFHHAWFHYPIRAVHFRWWHYHVCSTRSRDWLCIRLVISQTQTEPHRLTMTSNRRYAIRFMSHWFYNVIGFDGRALPARRRVCCAALGGDSRGARPDELIGNC